ncbi:MAG: RHS repeat-associated core domain-containing protein [Campylobacterales bacterium]
MGQEWDRETKLYYMHARYMDPRTCSFISVDPLVDNFISPNGERNLFGYGRANPVRYVDPTGMMGVDENAVEREIYEQEKRIREQNSQTTTCSRSHSYDGNGQHVDPSNPEPLPPFEVWREQQEQIRQENDISFAKNSTNCCSSALFFW